jgi:thimet oligopeptidase
MRLRTLFPLCVGLAVASACGSPDNPIRIPPPPAMPTPVPMPEPPPEPPPTPTAEIDPVASGLSVADITALCDEHIGRARTVLESIRALDKAAPDTLTWEGTVGRFDEIVLELSVAGGFPSLMALGHPDKDLREAAKACEPKVDKFRTDLMLDARFAGVIQRYAARKEPLEGVRERLLRELLRDLRRNGLELPPDKQARLREINDELTKLQQDFSSNISDAVLTIQVKPSQLEGLPESFLDQHKPGPDGLVTLTTNYPDYFPVVTYCEDRTVARDLTAKFDSRAAEKNLPILDRVLALRNEKAKLLGYETWADYAIEPRMAKTAGTVRDFLDRLSKELQEPARKEYQQFVAEYRRLGHKPGAQMPNYERLYVEQKLRERKYGFDAKELSKYLEVSAVTRGLLRIVERMYGIRLVPMRGAPTWHEDVRAYQVVDRGRPVGRIYLDLYPREGKYKHAAMFEIRPGKDLGDGLYLPPIAALVCNFPKPGESPALMTHNEVTTFFHEFGHVLHHVLTRQPLASYAGTNTARDFVETPSQMFEEWAYRKEILDTFAKHHETGKPIPEDLFKALIRSRAFGRTLHTERQVSLAALDLAYHSQPPPVDTAKVFAQVMAKTQRFAYLPDTHFQATFGHLMGYDAGYYSYQWALVIALDVLTRFEKEGYMNPKVAREWRRTVLEQGAGEDENKLVERFLGRPQNLDAYSRFLRAQ